MSSSSIFSNRLLRSRSLLQRCAGNHNLAPAVSSSSGEGGSNDRRMYQRPSHQNTFSIAHESRGPLSFQATASKKSQQQLKQQRHDRQRAFASSTAATPQESSLDAENQVRDRETKKDSAPASKPNIDPIQVENERRKVKDVSAIHGFDTKQTTRRLCFIGICDTQF